MVQYQITTVLNGEDELEHFVVGQRLAKEEEKRLAWERHYREAEKKLDDLKSEIRKLSKDKDELEQRLSELKYDIESETNKLSEDTASITHDEDEIKNA